MNNSLRRREASIKTLLQIENTPVNSYLLNKIVHRRKDIAMLTARYDEEVMDFIDHQHPDYIMVDSDALGNNVNEIYHALVELHEHHHGKLIVSSTDSASLRILAGWMNNLVIVDSPLNNQSLPELFDINNGTAVA